MAIQKGQSLKRSLIRNVEYFENQSLYDNLYKKSKANENFYKLLEIIESEDNIRLAYRNIKNNKGSKTAGVNNKTIVDIADANIDQLVKYVKNRLKDFKPQAVRRKYIPKANGKLRPLGIPTIEDRLIQQAIKQVLEPICEAKFHRYSYGFRANRSTQHAIALSYRYMQIYGLHYVVDIDIKGFFDNVNHGKLLKQMYSLGIRDKRLLSIIGKLLKAEIRGEGIPTKGTPQGGVLSPLLANIVLNEMDWWLASQWEQSPVAEERIVHSQKLGLVRGYQYKVLKKTKLKRFHFVRYADDFKIFCDDYETAVKIMVATKDWLQKRLSLEISEEKSKIVNLKKNFSEFLGFKMRLRKKDHKWKVISHVTDKAQNNIVKSLGSKLNSIKSSSDSINAANLNAYILGVHQYYQYATHVNIDFNSIYHRISRKFVRRIKRFDTGKGSISGVYKRLYGKYNYKRYWVGNSLIYPIKGIVTKAPLNMTQEICNYTEQGRALIHNKLKGKYKFNLIPIIRNPVRNQSVEFNDNRTTKFIAQQGICPISKLELTYDTMDCHHIIPVRYGGKDNYQNLVCLNRLAHKLIHLVDETLITQYIQILRLDSLQIEKVNQYRLKAKTEPIQI